MKVRIKGDLIRIRGENDEERAVLNEIWTEGIVAFAGGGELGICSKKHFGSGSRLSVQTPIKEGV